MRVCFCLFLLLSAPFLMASSEESLNTDIYLTSETKILHHLVEGGFVGKDSKSIKFGYLRNQNSKKSIILVPGFGESYKKYREVFFDFYNQGYSVFMFDLRGMGISESLQPNPQIIDVINFEDYVNDLQLFYETIVKQFNDEIVILAGHSTGGLVATYAVLNGVIKPHKLVLFSPLFKLNFSFLPQVFVEFLMKGSAIVRGDAGYIVGASDRTFTDYPIKNSTISSSAIRVKRALDIMRKYPQLLSGGPSNRWVLNILSATNDLKSKVGNFDVPVLLIQVEHDIYVDTVAHATICALMPDCKLELIGAAKHEILFEKDLYRNRALDLVFGFLSDNRL